jgi:replicative DNA helicase
VSDRCSCGRPLLDHPGDLEATCAECRSTPGYCGCPPILPTTWERPAPLGGHARLPGFPVGALPSWAAAEVAAVAEFTQTPADLGGTVLLGVLSAAAGGRAVVEVRGSWREPVNLYAVAALPSGARKSAVFAELTAPLLETEQSLVDKTRPVILENETQHRIAQRDAERAAMAATGLDDEERRQEATAAAIAKAQLAEAITIPVMPRLVADDVTPEAAATLLAEQSGRLAVLSAEGGIFSILAGRYSGGVPSLEVFLKGHSGDMLRVDRRGRPPEHIPQPALTLGLCVQPEILRAIAAMPGFRGRGLLARILYALPPNLVGRRRIGTLPVPDDVRDAYARSVTALVLTMADWTDPAVLTLTPDAAQLVLDAERRLEPRLDPDTGDLAGIVDWASKAIGATVRVAALLHLGGHLADGWGRPIGAETMQAAITVMDYYTAHALAAFDHMGVDPALEDARAVYRWLERTRPVSFTKRELFAAVSRSRFPKVGDLDAPLALLEQHGYIRRCPEPERTGPGRRPSPTYEAHPDLAAEAAVSALPRIP